MLTCLNEPGTSSTTLQLIAHRCQARISPHEFRARLLQRRVTSLELSRHRSFGLATGGSFQCLDVDAWSERYVLAGSSDGSMVVYDLERGHQTPVRALQPVAYVRR